jgi:transcriptional regulator with XRE-family HTH domain
MDVAKIMNTSQSAIARIESGQENITLDTIQRLVGALGGRFEVSIYPRELSPRQRTPWWEVDRSSWRITHIKGRRTPEAEQIIVGMERLNDLSSAGTLPVSSAMLPPPTATTPGGE